MLNMNLSSLVAALDPECRKALEDSAAACINRGSHEISIEDYLENLLELQPMRDILSQFSISAEAFRAVLSHPSGRAAGRGRPVFSPLLVELLQAAFLLNSLELHRTNIDVFTLILAILKNPARYSVMKFFAELGKIPADELARIMEGLDAGSQSQGGNSGPSPSAGSESYLKKYTMDFIEEARQGKIDPIFARGPHIRQMISILSRRRKNNPILVGDPGVGKTAVVEGLALKMVQGDVPESLIGTRIIGLDMGRLQAGASVKGEFEKRLKGVIDEVKASPRPTILFIDEAHTLVGAGNDAGGGDGANLLKPALARGELRTIAATTWSEYKKYFEKDAALARRFQLVKLDQPSLEETITILRGIVPHYEKNHLVYIRDDAVQATAELSTRYITGRQQPDKAIDVLDTACARVKVSLGAKPALLENMEEELASIQRELTALERDQCLGVRAAQAVEKATRHGELKVKMADLGERIVEITERWNKEKELVSTIVGMRTAGPIPPGGAPKDPGDHSEQSPGDESGNESEVVNEDEEARPVNWFIEELRTLQGDSPLVFYEVNPQLVATIVSEWTGVPLGKLTQSVVSTISNLGGRLRSRVRGQDHGLAALEKSILAARTGMNNPDAPTAIFLLVGPSGIGKTETALAIADELYGGERMLISINMSEFQEKHTISRLIGSPPGYVGYGEGGRLTEAVRRQPYSVVLFDEVEKAHPDVINLFYQMFDKGVLSDGEGREIDFRNTMIFLTSNLGSDIVSSLCEDEEAPDPSVLHEALRPVLTNFFKPALLGRMTIIPYISINPEIMKELVEMKLERIADRLQSTHRMALHWSEEVIDCIAASCTAVDTGARNIDHVINANLLPGISQILLGMLSGEATKSKSVTIGMDADNAGFTYTAGEAR